MRRIVVTAVLILALIALLAPAALGHNAGPCNDSGEPGHSDYARHHIVPADLGSGGHIPGTHHGYSLCIDKAGWK